MPFASGPVLCYKGGGRYETVGPTEYVGRDQVFHIPSGFSTDLASVPRVFWSLLPPDGVYENAAVVHDHFCAGLRAGTCEVSARDADAIFRRIAREGGTGFLTRWVLWTGVRWGALLFDAHRRPGIWRDMPLVSAITAVGLAATLAVVYGVHELIDLVFP